MRLLKYKSTASFQKVVLEVSSVVLGKLGLPTRIEMLAPRDYGVR